MNLIYSVEEHNPMWFLALIPPRWWVIIIVTLLFILYVLGAALFFFFSGDAFIGSSDEKIVSQGRGGNAQVSPELEALRPHFEKYARDHGMDDYVDLIMAIAMQESGGRVEDVMQSSESLGLPVNTLSQEASIDQGIKYFSQVLDIADGDVELALQSYNFGIGFINYAMEHNDGKYSKELAIEFSRMMYQRQKHKGMYSCIRPESAETGACYGDIGYVDAVYSYYQPAADNHGEYALPMDGEMRLTSEFGYRTHPVTGERGSFHRGTDYACTEHVTPIYSVADGEVVFAGVQGGYGNIVIVKHNDFYSAYAHLSTFTSSVGDSVKSGEQIAVCGNTGTSTAAHLHLEVRMARYGDQVDPVPFLGL
jgi:murein DD-endopeptidase MepM/ murein hydrolase activator NlpD